MYYIDARLRFEFYLPEELELGTVFVNILAHDQIEFWLLEEIPEDVDAFYEEHGPPVSFVIVDENDEKIAEGGEIAWIQTSDGDFLEELSIDYLNQVFMKYGSNLRIAIEEDPYDEFNLIVPTMHEDMVIIAHKLEEDDS